jgi:4-diphosphocytidyl-2-C-methyl-D-erythritol kinase
MPARAKINLGLRIFPRGPDGYHPLETVFCRIDLADRLRLRLRNDQQISLQINGPEWAPNGSENLAVQAAELFMQAAKTGLGAEIQLEKNIPAGAGLGGASSDAAAVLRLLARKIELPGGERSLLALASELGADVPFLAADVPYAFAWARGSRLLALPPVERRPMILLLPEFQVSSAEAYAAWDEWSDDRRLDPGEPLVRPWSALQSWTGLESLAVNDFEPVVFTRYPSLHRLRQRLEATQPRLTLLTGSGSALFGVFEGEEQRDEAFSQLAGELEEVRVVSACGPV